MKPILYLLFILFFAFLSNPANAQTSDSINAPLIYADELPTFPGGEDALNEFIKDKMDYPEDALNVGIWGRVLIRFAVSPSGDVKDISIEKNLYPSLDSVAVSIVEAMPKWIPIENATNDAYFTLPLFFSLPSPNTIRDRVIYNQPDERAHFVGEYKDMHDFIAKNLKYPVRSCQDCEIKGRVIVQFVVTKEGKVIDPIILRSLHEVCDKEAIRLVNSMPDWIPAKVKGEVVDSYYILPLTFRTNY